MFITPDQFPTTLCVFLLIGFCPLSNGVFRLRMPRCRPSDETCLCEAATSSLPLLKFANPSTGVPSIDPFQVKRLNVKRKNNSTVSFDQNYYDLDFIGYSSATVTRFKIQYDETYCRFIIDFFMEKFVMKSIYQWMGIVLGYPIDGIGSNMITSINVTHTHDITFNRMKDDRLLLKNYDMHLDPKSLSFDIANLVRDNVDASARALKLFNENYSVIFNEVKLNYNKAFSQCFQPYVCALFEGVTFNDIFLPEVAKETKVDGKGKKIKAE